MSPSFTQENRLIKITTPLGKDALLLQGFSGQEGISSLFHFHLDLLAENRVVIPFEDLLGKRVSIEMVLPNDEVRYFNGIVNTISQGGRDYKFTKYRAEMVPQFWLLTRRIQSRIFQTVSVPDILRSVFDGLDIDFQIQGSFEPRDYCTQYRESDFQFASRLMEEEGIYYFFKHTADSHKMVIADTPQSHPDLPVSSRLIYDELSGGGRAEDRVYRWEKSQELRSGKSTLWDHSFELPGKHLEAEKTILENVQAGKVVHKLKVGGNDTFEIYDYPGAYAQRFDGVAPGGGDAAGELQKIFADNKRTVGIRMQQEALPSLLISAASNCRQVTSGHKFHLDEHFNADGQYVVTSVSHVAQHGFDSNTGMDTGNNHYSNVLTCIPFALPFRPPRTTPRPFLHGSQTATVVGPSGEEIFTDKYSRVKVQFHWDREGKYDANSSCWVRVGTPWAGKKWGMIHIPRLGQEVIVDFLEGDPDQPIIVGSVYNADQMPPYQLPDNKTRSGIRSRTVKGSEDNFNEIRFEDKMGKEQVIIHAERDKLESVEHDSIEYVGNDRSLKVKMNQMEMVEQDKHLHVKGNLTEKIEAGMSHSVGGKRNEKVSTNYALDSGMEIHLKAGMKVIIEAGVQISLKGPGGFVDIGPAGVTIQGTVVLINSGGAAGSGSGSSPESPKDPDVQGIDNWGAQS